MKLSTTRAMKSFIFISWCFLTFSLYISSSTEPLTHQAARLILYGLVSEESGKFGKSKGSKQDLYHQLIGGNQIKVYRPEIFKLIRSNSGISETVYQSSLNPDVLECLSSDSKSGQAFWRATNGIIILKTIKPYECRNLRNILPEYSYHITSGISCISAIVGLYS